MPKRDAYNILFEKYDTLITEERVVRQVPFSTNELKVLVALYDFSVVKDDNTEVKRIPTAGVVEIIVKYSDDSFVRMVDDARGVTKHEYKSFYELVQKLTEIYKVDAQVAKTQTPQGPDNPYGVEKGGTYQLNQRYGM